MANLDARDSEAREWIRYLERRIESAPDKAELDRVLGRISDLNKKLEEFHGRLDKLEVLISRLVTGAVEASLE